MDQSIVAELKENGFVKNSENILTSDELYELKNCINKLFSDKSIDINTSSNALVIDRLAGIIPNLDFLLTKLVTHENVKFVLNQVLGDNYKIWQLTVRRSIPGDTGLDLHQDAPGETNIALLLTDNFKGDGATAFLPKSHQLPRWSGKISWSSVTISFPFLSPLRGKIGDVAFFFNRTWHARLQNRSKQTHDVILISFFPQGAIYSSVWDEERLKRLSQPELRKLLDPNDGRIQIIAKENDDKNMSYAMKLENSEYLKGLYGVKLLALKVLLLQLVFSPIRWLYRLAKSLKILIISK
jgi:non-haem Fe2+, alpha-ketoglutarate-dependent halogenase